MRYKVGDKITVQYEVMDVEGDSYYRIGENGYLSQSHVDKYAVEPPAPALTRPDGWKPVKGERVLIEAEYTGNPDEDGDVLVTFQYNYRGKECHESLRVDPSTVYPYPASQRFKVGDDVFILSVMNSGKLVEKRHGWMWKIRTEDMMVVAAESDLIPLDEARERLAR